MASENTCWWQQKRIQQSCRWSCWETCSNLYVQWIWNHDGPHDVRKTRCVVWDSIVDIYNIIIKSYYIYIHTCMFYHLYISLLTTCLFVVPCDQLTWHPRHAGAGLGYAKTSPLCSYLLKNTGFGDLWLQFIWSLIMAWWTMNHPIVSNSEKSDQSLYTIDTCTVDVCKPTS